ncbi:MAG TPA: protein-glutamate O-methyltransferase CheR, partial [Thermoanaerobaculia bacterium]
MEITNREFALFQRLIHRQTGIFLPEAKKALVVPRLSRRLRALALTSYAAYLELVERDRNEHTVMLDAICTNETRFFREPRQFEFLESEVLPRWRQRGDDGLMPKRIRAWSAACSTGEEPYSLAMMLRTHFPASGGWSVEVLASDLSTKVLAAAREGVWPIERAEEIPAEYRRAYMLRGVRGEEGKMRAQPNIRELVELRRLNLNDEQYAVDGPFDLIFCRNVLIYF